MADTKISALPASTTPLAGTEVLPIVQSSSTVKVAVSDLTAGRAVATGALTVTGALSTTTGMFTTGQITIAQANTAAYDISGGAARFVSFGADNSTQGTFKFLTATANASVTVTPVTINSNGLAVTGTLSATGTLSGGTSGTGYSFSGSAPATSLTLDSSGNLLVGTPSNTYSSKAVFYNATNTVIHSETGSTGTSNQILFINPNGIVGSVTTNGSATLYNVTSDYRLKENIVDAPDFGSLIDSIQVRSFDWKADGSHQRAGFVAQELVTVAPEAVHQPTDTEQMMAVDYSKLVPMLVKEIQSLRARVAQLESKP